MTACDRSRQGAVGGVVCRLDAFHVRRSPEPLAVCIQFAARFRQAFVSAALSAQQQMIHHVSNGLHLCLECQSGDFAGLVWIPDAEDDSNLLF